MAHSNPKREPRVPTVKAAPQPPLTLVQQVAAARAEVATWPKSVQEATRLRMADFFR